MADQGNKIDWVMGLIIALIGVGIIWGISSLIFNRIENAKGSIERRFDMMDSYEYSAYDNKKVTGDSVIAAVKMAKTPTPIKLEVEVQTGRNTSKTTSQYGYADNAGSYTAYTVNDPASSAYINPAATFTATISYNSNGVVNKITFIQDTE